MKQKFFTSRELVLMSLLGCLSSLATLTTAFIPAPIPGLYAVIAIPAGTIFLLTSREIVGKNGAATFTQTVSGIISTLLPGGPPVKWIIAPSWIVGGIIIDLLFHLYPQNPKPRIFFVVAGLTYIIPGDLLLYWTFSTFLGWMWPLNFFLYGFILIHSILGGLAGMLMPEMLKRVRCVVK